MEFQESVVITKGPSKHELFGAFKDREDIVFEIETMSTPLTVTVNTLEYEDGSGNSWNLKGFLPGSSTGQAFKAYYNSDTRRGSLSLEQRARVTA